MPAYIIYARLAYYNYLRKILQEIFEFEALNDRIDNIDTKNDWKTEN